MSTGANAAVTNSGTVTTSGASAHGVYSLGTGAAITNTGMITTSGAGAVGVLLTQQGALVNAGTIVSENGHAVQLSWGDDTLTLTPNSIIDGFVALGAGVDTLIVQNGLSIAYTFDSAPEVLVANGAPYAILGNQVAVLDPTSLVMQREILIDQSQLLSATVHNRLDGFAADFVGGRRSPALGTGCLATSAENRPPELSPVENWRLEGSRPASIF